MFVRYVIDAIIDPEYARTVCDRYKQQEQVIEAKKK